MASEGVVSVVEDVIKQHGPRLSDIDLASRRAEEAATRRSDAAGWLRRTVGVVIGKDLPEQPSEEEFRLGLRNGIILCNAFNKVYPGTIPKVVEPPADSFGVPDGAALSAFQYFENLRNFLVALEDKGLPTFEASDLEKGGKGSRVVDSILALKSDSQCKQMGRHNSMKHGGVSKPVGSGLYFFKRNAEVFMNSLSRSQSVNGSSSDRNLTEDFSFELDEMKSGPLHMLVRSILSDKKPEDVPFLVESLLGKIMQEFERQLANQNEMARTTSNDVSVGKKSVPAIETKSTSSETKIEVKDADSLTMPTEEEPTMSKEGERKEESPKKEIQTQKEESSKKDALKQPEESSKKEILKQQEESSKKQILKQQEELSRKEILKQQEEPMKEILKQQEESLKKRILKQQEELLKKRILKQQVIFDRQQREIEELKQTLNTTKAGLEFMKSQCSVEFNNLSKHLQVISSAAAGYHKVLEENRKLYNQIQDLKGNIRVYCRVRPFLPGQLSGVNSIGHIDDGSITIITPSKYGKESRRSFNFNRVFSPSATQEEVFSDTRPLIRSVLDGYNVCIFAYGQTGSGKTHTMSGPNELNEQTVGVNYRALNDLFYLSEQRKDTFNYQISVQMLEIYNEQVRDLLDSEGHNKKLEIRNSSQNGLNVPDANVFPVASPSDVIELMNLGHKNRAVSATAMNDRSSRSHSCLTIHVKGKDLTSGNTIRGSMHLVDLAGSERVDKSQVKGDRLKEATHINKSLSALGDVIASLAQKSPHVPYRNSKLTQLLQDSLGGQAKTLMFVCMSPEMDAVGETLSTLKFAERVATVELGAAKSNKESGEVKELKEQIANLKAALAGKEGESDPIRSIMSSPELYGMKNGTTSPEEDLGDLTNHRQQPAQDVGNLEVVRDDDSLSDDFHHQRYLKEIPEDDVQRSRVDSDSDDSEVATSNSSEYDMHYQSNLPKTIPINGGKPMIKKPKSKIIKSPDTRSVPSNIPPSRKVSNGSSTQTPNRLVRPVSAGGGAEMKRTTSNGKLRNAK